MSVAAMLAVVVASALPVAGSAVASCENAPPIADALPMGLARVHTDGIGWMELETFDAQVPLSGSQVVVGIDLHIVFPAHLGGAATSVSAVADVGGLLDQYRAGAQDIRITGAIGILTASPVHVRCIDASGNYHDDRVHRITFRPFDALPNSLAVTVQRPGVP